MLLEIAAQLLPQAIESLGAKGWEVGNRRGSQLSRQVPRNDSGHLFESVELPLILVNEQTDL